MGWQEDLEMIRVQKEEKVVVVLLLMALGSLAIAFWAFEPEEGASSALSGSTGSIGSAGALFAGTSSTDQIVQGNILEMKSTKTGGNLILWLNSTAMPIFIPSSAGAEQIKNRIQPGDRIQVKGKIYDYQGGNELKVSRAGDVREI
jgi:DNA/RNA endonuclease YhcR with UshA esterase domain